MHNQSSVHSKVKQNVTHNPDDQKNKENLYSKRFFNSSKLYKILHYNFRTILEIIIKHI